MSDWCVPCFPSETTGDLPLAEEYKRMHASRQYMSLAKQVRKIQYNLATLVSE